MKRLSVVILMLCFISACAVKPVSSTQTNSILNVSLSGVDKEAYLLVDSWGNVIAEDRGNDGKLNFRIPGKRSIQSCVHVENKEGKRLGEESYRLSLINEFRAVDKYMSVLDKRYTSMNQQYVNLNKAFQDIKIQLEGHSAFADRRCHLPAQRSLPPKPRTRCNSYDECLEEGGAICYSRFIGTEGCSLALKELNVSGMLSSPGCSAVAAELAGEKYAMEDAFVDFLHGVADDIGGDLLKSESMGDNILGLIFLGGNYWIKLDKARTCTNNFVQQYYGPRIVWAQKVKEIRLEPQIVRSNCQRLIARHNDYYKKLNAVKSSLKDLQTKFADIRVIHDELSSRESLSPKCQGRSHAVVEREAGFAKRFLIGTVIGDKIQAKGKSGKGLRVFSLVENSPAKKSGIQIDDQILRVNNVQVNDILGLTRAVQRSQGKPLSIMLARQNKPHKINITPIFKQVRLSD